MEVLTKWKLAMGAAGLAVSATAGFVATTSGVAFADPAIPGCSQGTGTGPSLGAHSNPLKNTVTICNNGQDSMTLDSNTTSLGLQWYIGGGDSAVGSTTNIANASFVLVYGCTDNKSPIIASSTVPVPTSYSSYKYTHPSGLPVSLDFNLPTGICPTGSQVIVTDQSYFTGDVYNSVPTEIKFYWNVKTPTTTEHKSGDNSPGDKSSGDQAAIGGHDWVFGMADPGALIPALGGAAPLGGGLLVIAGGSVAYVATRSRRRRSVAETSN